MTMPRHNGDDLAALAKHKRMATLLRGEVPSSFVNTPKRLEDVSMTTWCSKEHRRVDEPYHFMPNDNMWAYLKDRIKKAAADGLKI
jgi:hypothetical protein